MYERERIKFKYKKTKPITGHRTLKRSDMFRTKREKERDRKFTFRDLLNYE